VWNTLDLDTLTDVLLDVRSLDRLTVVVSIVLTDNTTLEGAADQICRFHTHTRSGVTTGFDELLEVNTSDLVLEVETLPMTSVMVLLARFDNLQGDILVRVTILVLLFLDVKDFEDMDTSGYDGHFIRGFVKVN